MKEEPHQTHFMKVESLLPYVIAFSILGSCTPGTTDKPEPAKDEAAKPPVKGPELVGRIASVPQDKRFVLIQSYGKWNGESGQILTTRGPDNRSANLRITGEKLAEFAAADVQSGEVQTGDAVYSQHVPKPVNDTAPAEVALPQGLPAAENVQKNN